ncbi:MAG: biotin transporter BioY [Candidatus Nanopelagicales bacterium]|jgi:biotin transport system substrate-specific component|nr:biotin transporter BioY [Candidatus Nanopelagicales bacterium]MCU0300799.1 biotin transporter BioY [Candidatus Nanopelagicales bacterium]
MSLATPVPGVLADVLPRTAVRNAILVIGGAAFVGLAAQVAIPLPFTPVPVTGQTFAVLLTAAALGTWRGVAAMLLYAVMGLAGVPWFAGGSAAFKEGALVVSFGYVLGFVVAAALVGWLAERGNTRTALRTAGLMVVGNLVIYTIGASWLAAAIDVPLAKAVELGVTPFMLGDALKVALAAGLFPLAWRAVERFTKG